MSSSTPGTARRVFVVTSGTSLARNMMALSDAFARLPGGGSTWRGLFVRCLQPRRPAPDSRDPGDRAMSTATRLLEWGKDNGLVEITDGGECDDRFLSEEGAAHFAGLSWLLEEELAGMDSDGPVGAGLTWLSAELTSLFSTGAEHPEYPRSGDHVILVSTDTPVGERHARFVGRVLANRVGGKVESVRIEGATCGSRDDRAPRDLLAPLVKQPGVTVATVAGMNFEESDVFARTSSGIAEILAHGYTAAANENGGALIVHPIGGLKETIPVVTTLAAHLPVDGLTSVSMWYANEESRRAVRLPLLRVGLPGRELRDLDTIASEPEESGHPVALATSAWSDYAWTRSGATFNLTYVGCGILRIRGIVRDGKRPVR